MANSVLHVFHRYVGHRLVPQRPDDVEAGFTEYEDSKLMATLTLLATLLSSTIPVASTVVLYMVRGMPLRLAMIALFVTLFCGILAIFTNARRVEIFAATAAYVSQMLPSFPTCWAIAYERPLNGIPLTTDPI